MILTPKQTEAIQNKSRYKVYNWGRRSGKTTLFAYEALGTALTIDDAKITYYAQTFGDARDIAWDIFLEVLGGSIIKKNESLLEITVKNLKGGTSKISLKGWESVVLGGKGRGTENDLLLFDEVAFCRGFLEKYRNVLKPTLLTTKGRACFGSTPNGFNDFYDLSIVSQRDGEYFYSHATSYDNPFNDPKEIEKIRLSEPADSFAQEYMADFRKQEGLVYKEFSRAVHLFSDEREEKIDVASWIAGVDFGFVNPAGIVSIKKDKRGVYWVTDEYYEKGKTDAQIAELVASKEFNKVYPDPENQGAIKELKDRHVNCMEVVKDSGSVKRGVDKIRSLLLQNRMKIHERCTNLIWELETCHYPKARLEKNDNENPVKKNDHLLDAVRYVMLMDCDNIEIKNYEVWIDDIREKSRKINPAR